MAQPTVISMADNKGKVNGGGAGNGTLISSLPPDKLVEIREYEKLVRFYDGVAAGSHPRIKPKPKQSQANGKSASEHGAGPGSSAPSNATNTTTPTKSQMKSAKASKTGNRPVISNSQSYQTNSQRPPVNPSSALPGLKTLSGSSWGQPKTGPGKVAINPVLLEKSDDLIKAELQLQRQRLERGLREEVEEKRAALKASAQAEEQLADLDIVDVLTKALGVIQTTNAQPTDDTAANASASSDSFDDNTFYSSQNDTPQSHQLSRLANDSDDEQMRDASPYEPEFEPEPATQSSQEHDVGQVGLLASALRPQQHHVAPSTSTPSSIVPQNGHANPAPPGLSSSATSVSPAFRHLITQETVSSQGSGPASRSDESLITGQGRTADSRSLARVSERLLNQGIHGEQSPVVRAHDLSPVAPQPAHVSSLVVTRQQQMALSDSSGRRGTPAQVAALRKQPSAATSPESSPGNRPPEKKKSKKKKRKADRLAAEAAAVTSPYIKPEPRSPSPLSAQPYLRPAKRQRQARSQAQPPSAANNESRYDQPIIVDDSYGERYQAARPFKETRDAEYRQSEHAPRHQTEQGPVTYGYPTAYERVYYEDSRPPPGPGPRQGAQNSPGAHQVAYMPREVRSGRSVSHVVEGSFGDATSYIREAPASSRMSMRPPAGYRERSGSPVAYERAIGHMGPPKTQQTRIIVDQYGREYIEPPPRPPIITRDSVMPERPADSEIIYGRPPPSRAISRRPDVYEDDTATYRQPETTYPAPRRVVTQPELAGPDQRTYREISYPSHAMPPPPGEYLPPRPRADSRTVGEPPREYIARPTSVRPPVEHGRYEGSTVAYDRRPPPDEYYGVRAASVRPPEGTRYEIPVAYERRVGGDEPFREYTAIRSASVRPAEPMRYEVGREYSGVRPDLPIVDDYPGSGLRLVSGGDGAPSHVVRQGSGVVQPPERYYARPPVQEDEEIVYVGRPPRDMYRQVR